MIHLDLRQTQQPDMQINSPPTEGPVELDADDPVERVLLSTQSGEWELRFFLESSNGHYWRVVELVKSASVPHREVVRYLDLEKNAVLPLGILQASGTNDWNAVVVYDKGQVIYPLLNQGEASKFQRLITGYNVSKRYANVTCGVIFKSRWKIRDDEDGGIGELQLWDWPETQRAGQAQSPRARSMQTSRWSGSIASTVQTLSKPDGSVSLQTAGGRELLLSSVAPSRVLVLFLQGRDSYKMFKVDFTDLEIRLSESRLDFFKASSGTFGLEKLSVKKLAHWNLGLMRPTLNSPAIEGLKCTYLSLQFQTPRLAASFVASLTSIETKTPTSPVSRTISPSFDSLPHIPSMQPIDDPTLWRVRSEPQRASVTRPDSTSDPLVEQQIPELENARQLGGEPQQAVFHPVYIAPQQILGLETERPIQEIHGAELGCRYELPNQENIRKTSIRRELDSSPYKATIKLLLLSKHITRSYLSLQVFLKRKEATTSPVAVVARRFMQVGHARWYFRQKPVADRG
ncbi:hypothetical protein GQ44DRAFT_780207 [Phaeosphaeriaceae sp. PMI808]|nr:hypothetical protein GQ44DRAFT_780207 [Phaeosphaeriaceae sp. PMI808]